jgi:hypothetical protein
MEPLRMLPCNTGLAGKPASFDNMQGHPGFGSIQRQAPMQYH